MSFLLPSNPIVARDPYEPNRASTTLELLFDLVYVIAVSAAASGFYRRLIEHDLSGFITFTLAFFILWNAWTSFTWFGSGYDPDDTPYRISVMFQMFGSLLIAANISRFFEQGLMWIGVVGYAIMRLASCSQWLRVYHDVPGHKQVALRSIIGLLTLQAMWVSWLFLPKSAQTPALVIFIIAELLMPIWARADQFDNWHPGHLAERYGLLTIIVLGEGILGVSGTIQSFIIDPSFVAKDILVTASALVALLFAIWWLYFSVPFDSILQEERRRHDLAAFGYGHFFIFASLAGIGSAMRLVADALNNEANVTNNGVTMPYAMGIIMLQLAVFLITLWTLRHIVSRNSQHSILTLFIALAVLVLCFIMVVQGLSIGYAVWISVITPVGMIIKFNSEHRYFQSISPNKD
ncbi:low temperature requirement protein A [Psychrobacter sp.]|uniref:low temperature requirement protein A n=1 Tax=Psychrobacter sp. TaxID=56811 RepID=UPI0025CF5450|nr:low temperature requirement protein A [Psychrobacter sp.]